MASIFIDTLDVLTRFEYVTVRARQLNLVVDETFLIMAHEVLKPSMAFDPLLFRWEHRPLGSSMYATVYEDGCDAALQGEQSIRILAYPQGRVIIIGGRVVS